MFLLTVVVDFKYFHSHKTFQKTKRTVFLYLEYLKTDQI